MVKLVLLLLFLALASGQFNPEKDHAIHPHLGQTYKNVGSNSEEQFGDFWNKKAQSAVLEKIHQTEELNTQKARNIIIFLGDGMSVHTVAATRAFIGDTSHQLSFEKFPYFGLSKTYCVNKQVADSACSATAYLSGVKANYGTIGVTAEVPRSDCTKASDPSTHTVSIAKWAQDAGKATGVVTTTRITHASPAGVYAHTANRDWENDNKVKSKGCSTDLNPDIAHQLIHGDVGNRLNVVLGGGRREFRDKKMKDEEGLPGTRTDGRDLIEEFKQSKWSDGFNATYVWSRKGLMSVDLDNTDYLLGLFSSDHCPYHGDRKRGKLEKAEPSLSEMTEVAVRRLQRNSNGFFLFVEGGKIDLAHHGTKARKALEETEEFARAVQTARDLTSEEDTLIIVTSDHAHTMTINGYPTRGTDILGLTGKNAEDARPFTTLSYANGPGYYTAYDQSGRRDISEDNREDANYQFMATAPLGVESHGGDDVGIFASGPQAHLFAGNYEQSNIPMLMAHAAEIGPFRK